MDVIQLSAESKRKPVAQVGKDLGLRPQFASPAELQQTVLLLSKHVDELRTRVGLLEIDVRTPWYGRVWRGIVNRWRAST